MWAIKKGFTLVELIMTLGIVAVLSTSVAYVSVTGNLQKSRDNKRKTDLEAVRSALELYRSDTLGVYPNVDYTTLKTTLVNYAALPNDPSTGKNYWFLAVLSGTKYTKYCLGAYMEKAAAVAVSGCTPPVGSCGTGFTCNYVVAQP